MALDLFDISARTKNFLIVYDIVLLASLLWFMVQFFRFAFPPLFETFQMQFGVSNTATGLLFSVLMLFYSLSQFPAGVLSDKYGKVEIITISVAGLSFGAILVLLAPTFALITLAAAVIGVMSGAHKTISVPLLSNRYEDQTGFALGLFESIGQLGGAIAPIVVVVAFTLLFPWQTVFAFGTIISILLGVLFYLRVDDGSRGSSDSEDPRTDPKTSRGDQTDALQRKTDTVTNTRRYITAIADAKLILFLSAAFGFTFTWNGISSFLPLFLIDEKNLSNSFAGILYSGIFFVSFSQIITGDLSDKIGRIRLSILLVVVVIVGLGSLLIFSDIVVLVVATIALGIGLHGFRPVRDAYLVDLMPADIEGGLFGLVRTVKTGVGAIAPIFVGYVSDVASFSGAFCGLLLASLFSFVCLLLLQLQ